MEPENNISTTDNGKTAAIVSYITIIGWLIAYFGMHKDKKTELGSYQLRQTLLFHIAAIVISWALAWLFGIIFLTSSFGSGLLLISTLNWIVRVGFFIMWLIGFLGAVNGEKKPIPLIGDKAQAMFSSI
jgi:uncharacterized membrane protein